MTTPNIRELRRQRARHATGGPVWIKLLVVLAGLYVVYVLAGFFVAPSLVKTQLERRVSDQLKREVHIDRVAFNPFALSLRIDKLVARDHGGQPLVGWERLFLNFELFSLFAEEIHFSEIELDGFASRLAVSKEGILNIADIGLPNSSKSTAGKSWTLRIDRLAVNRAEIDYSDASRADPFTTHIGPTTFVLREFRTSGGPGAPGVFKATTEAGESISWSGRLALAPLRSNGEIRIGQLALKKYAPFYSRLVQFDLSGGTVDIQAPYEFSIQNNKPQIKVTEAAVQVQDLALVERGQRDAVVSVKTVEVTRASFDLQANSTDIRQVNLTGGRLIARRDAKGINLVSLLAAKPQAKSSSSSTANNVPALAGKIAEINAKDLTLSFEDKTTPRPGSLDLNHASFSVKHISLADLSALVPVDLRGDLSPGGGTVHLEGQVSAQPLKADLSFALEGVALVNLSPWVETVADVRLTQGIAGVRGKVHLTEGSGGAAVVTATADADIGLLSATDARGGELLRWKSLAVRGAEYGSNPARLTVTEISLADPEVKLLMNKDHALNVSTLMRQTPPTVSAPLPSATAPATFIALDRIALANASVRFLDESIEPSVTMSIEQLSGTMTGMTSAIIDRGDLVFNGRIAGAAPLTVTGKANLLSTQPAWDLKMELRNSDLLPLGPYVGKFVGYELASGALSLDTRAKVVNRKLDSTSNVTVTNFTLGAPTNSPDAPHVPVQLALALLRDAEGKIVLSLPVQGGLDDPSFQIGGVVMQVIRNLITKAATSPFTLIGAMFGGNKSGEDLSFQEFAPGTAELAENATGKLDVVARALRERPALRLAVMGNTDPAADLTTMKEQELERRIRTSIWEDVRKVDPAIDSPEGITVSVGAANRVIGLLYQDAFMHSAPEIVSTPTTGPTEAPRKRLFLFRWFTRSKPEPAPTPPSPPALRPSGGKPSPTLAAAAAPTPVVLPSVDEMRRRLLEAVPVGEEELQKLAANRAQSVRTYITTRGQVSPDRVEVVAREGALKPSRRVILQLQ